MFLKFILTRYKEYQGDMRLGRFYNDDETVKESVRVRNK
jgi:hypothetical protein